MIQLKSPREIEIMAGGGRILGATIELLTSRVIPGISTGELDQIADEFIRSHEGAVPAFKGLYGFPGSVCLSVNQEIVHGIPSPKRVLREGDIISLDFGVELDGYFGDAAVTVPVGKVKPELETLLRVTRESLDHGIEQARVGNRLSDIGSAVQKWVERHGFSVVREFVGHGIGTKMHEEPNVLNYGEPGHGPRLQEGMVLALEPMVNMGEPGVWVLADEWTAVTTDGKPSAHFEHTIAITANGPRILTRPDDVKGNSW